MRIARLAVAVCVALSASAARAADGPLDSLKTWLARPAEQRPPLADQPFAAAPLPKADAATAKDLLWADHLADAKAHRAQELTDQSITLDGHTMRLLTKSFGHKPAGGWNLFISMHGGGNAPAQVNDQQWQNQIKLYHPTDSLVVAPRAPTNDWDLWHKDHIDPLFTRLVDDLIALRDVNPNRVYLMGYSAGGDGCYQLAPRMADHWAAASMMAGHPGDANPISLRDLPFALHVGALDAAYHRNELVPEWGRKLDALAAADPGGYVHVAKAHPGRAHWMNLEDAEAIPWMLQYTRDPLPAKVAWAQDDVTHDRFYWLASPQPKAKQVAIVHRDGQTFTVDRADGLRTLTVMLNDDMADLDQPVTIKMGDRTLSSAKPVRTVAMLAKTLADRGDPALVFSATATVDVSRP